MRSATQLILMGLLTLGATASTSGTDPILEVKGYLIPVYQVQVSPKVAGQVVKLAFREGDRVQRGAVLAELESTEYQAEFDRSAADVVAARARYEDLADNARPEDRARVEIAWAELRRAKADRAKAKWRLESCVVRAPITGIILTKITEEGNVIDRAAPNLKASICDMADLSEMEVDLRIQERDIAKVRTGFHCAIFAEAYPMRRYEGHVDRVLPIADRALGAVAVRVRVRIPRIEEGMYLRPEMGVIVRIEGDKS